MGMIEVHGNAQDYRDELHRQSKRILDLIQENEQLRATIKALCKRAKIKCPI